MLTQPISNESQLSNKSNNVNHAREWTALVAIVQVTYSMLTLSNVLINPPVY